MKGARKDTQRATELQEKHHREMTDLRASHEAQIAELTSAHEKKTSDLKIAHKAEIATIMESGVQTELRKIKEEFEHDKQQAVTDATNKTAQQVRGIMSDEIRSLQAQHTAALGNLEQKHQHEIHELRAHLESDKHKAIEHALARQREEMKKKTNGELKTLSDAHSAKTASLENELAEAKNAQHVAEEKARKAAEYEHKLESASKEAAALKAELDVTKAKLKNVETGHAEYDFA